MSTTNENDNTNVDDVIKDVRGTISSCLDASSTTETMAIPIAEEVNVSTVHAPIANAPQLLPCN